MNTKLLATGVALAMGAGIAATAVAQVKPEVLVKQRQAAMVLQGKYLGPIGGMLKGNIPYNADTVVLNATFLENLARMPWDGFNPNTKDEKTAALPAVYNDKAKFDEIASRLENEASRLATVSRSGDEAAVKAQITAVGKVCGACHNDFRAKK